MMRPPSIVLLALGATAAAELSLQRDFRMIHYEETLQQQATTTPIVEMRRADLLRELQGGRPGEAQHLF